ncbi:MAG: HAD-IIB family hydrolase [bacterium]|nr:HAD-IIB family hydrolase [bacterium]
MRNKKLIIFDLDGTLAPSKSPMDADMSGLLSDLLRTRMVAVISGGSLAQFQKQFLGSLNAAPELLKNLYLFPTCGAAFYRYKESSGAWQCVYTEALTADEKVRAGSAFTKAFRDLNHKHPETLYGDVLEDRGTQVTFSALGQRAPLPLKAAWDPDSKKRLRIAEAVQKYIPDLEVRVGGTTSIDITRPGVDKAYGIKKMEEYLGVTKAEMLFVGDAIFPGGNDYPPKAMGVDCVPVENPDDTKGLIRTLLVV